MMSMTLSQWIADEFGDCQLFPGNRREEVMRLKHFCPTCQTDADAIARSVLVFTLKSPFENDFKIGSFSEESIMRMGRRMEVWSANLGLAMSNKWEKYGFSSGYVELPSKVEVSSICPIVHA